MSLYETAQSWRKKLRLQQLVDIAQAELESGKDIEHVWLRLDQEMKSRWNLVFTTRKQYLEIINKIFKNQYFL